MYNLELAKRDLCGLGAESEFVVNSMLCFFQNDPPLEDRGSFWQKHDPAPRPKGSRFAKPKLYIPQERKYVRTYTYLLMPYLSPKI